MARERLPVAIASASSSLTLDSRGIDQASGRTSFESADAIIAYVTEQGLTVDWILETHAHADHLSAAPYLQEKLGGKLAIGREIVTVQGVFGKICEGDGKDVCKEVGISAMKTASSNDYQTVITAYSKQ